jgi:hypothetical protein
MRGTAVAARLALVAALLSVAGCASSGTPTPFHDAGATPMVLTVQSPWPTGAHSCPVAMTSGRLVRNVSWGLVLIEDGTSITTRVIWPPGYSAREGSLIEVLDDKGRVVARELDHVSLPGGYLADREWTVCPGLDPVASPS